MKLPRAPRRLAGLALASLLAAPPALIGCEVLRAVSGDEATSGRCRLEESASRPRSCCPAPGWIAPLPGCCVRGADPEPSSLPGASLAAVPSRPSEAFRLEAPSLAFLAPLAAPAETLSRHGPTAPAAGIFTIHEGSLFLVHRSLLL